MSPVNQIPHSDSLGRRDIGIRVRGISISLAGAYYMELKNVGEMHFAIALSMKKE